MNKIQGRREIGSHAIPGSGKSCRLAQTEEGRGAPAVEGNRAIWMVHIGWWLSCLQLRGYPGVSGSTVEWEGMDRSQETHVQILPLSPACYLL